MRYLPLGFGLLATTACMSNFDQFVLKDGSVTDGVSEAAADAAAPCDASAGCIQGAMACGNICRSNQQMCINGCFNQGCKNNCMQTGSTCLAKCRSDCTACAGASCTTPCQTAVGN